MLGSLSYLAPLLSTGLLVLSGQVQAQPVQAQPVQALALVVLLAGAWLSARSRSTG